MAFRIENLPQKQTQSGVPASSDIVFYGFSEGMADSAESGIQLIKNANIISAPGELMVNYKMTSVTIPPTISAADATFTGATDIITSAVAIGGGLVSGMAVYFGSTAGGVTANVPYWVGNVSGNTFKIYDHISKTGSAVNITDTSNTLSTYVMGAMKHHAESTSTNPDVSPSFSPKNFFLDGNGRAWFVNSSSVLVFMGNTTLTDATGNGLAVIGGSVSTPGYLLVFRETDIDTFPLDGLGNSSGTVSQWTFGWGDSIFGYTNISHQALSTSTFNGVIFCNGTTVGTIRLSSATFDPSNAATFDRDDSALLLPSVDRTTWIAELNNVFLIGGEQTYIYTWSGNQDLYDFLILPEANIQKIIATSSNAYIFAGNRGRIYLTNGSNVELFRKFPDQVGSITIGPDPYLVWGGALYWRNQLYFGIQFVTNAGSASLQNSGGIWAIDLDTGALRHTNDTAAGSTSTTPVIAPNVSSSTPGGGGLYAASTDLAGTAFTLDVSTTTPYTDGSTIINTDIVPAATFYTNRTFSQAEYKLSRPLVTGESIAIGWRDVLSETFTQLTVDSTQVGSMSGVFVSNMDPVQYVQLQIALTSTASSPSYCRLTEVRLR